MFYFRLDIFFWQSKECKYWQRYAKKVSDLPFGFEVQARCGTVPSNIHLQKQLHEEHYVIF